MRVLVACEFSGTVRDAFIARGHDAVSCDLLPTENPGPHIQGDVLAILGGGWDLMIAHPPCTYLASSGLHWNKRRPERAALTEASLEFVRALLDAPIPQIALENPVGCISSRIRKPDQIIQPWQFGHDASKATCLWLRGLRPLEHTKITPPGGWSLVRFAADMLECDGCDDLFCPEHEAHYADYKCVGPTQDGYEYREIAGYLFAAPECKATRPVWSNQTPSGQNRLGPSPDRWKLRAETYTGIAEAMADQWGRA